MLYSLNIEEFNTLWISLQNTFKIKPLNVVKNIDDNLVVYFEVFIIETSENNAIFLKSIFHISDKKSLKCYDIEEQIIFDTIIIKNSELLEYYTDQGIHYYTCLHEKEADDWVKKNGMTLITRLEDGKFLLKFNKYIEDIFTTECLNPPILKHLNINDINDLL